MSVINRVEVANFLNLDNIAPTQQGWKPDYIHVVLNFRGESAAVVATNGLGKTTINRALYAILTRDSAFHTQVKQVAAPKRIGAYSHIRLEVLFRDKDVGNLLGRMGADVPGEPYVFGMYGHADGDVVYYTYQGFLEDCPVAHRQGGRVRIVGNQVFRDVLKARAGAVHNPTKEEWAGLVGRHFDLTMLQQMVNYQKVGAGDSAEDFFKVKERRSTGKTDAYDSAFFYEFIAPEVLANAMYGEDKDNLEPRFEDTILRSAGPLINAEQECDRLRVALARDTMTFEAVERVNDHLTQFVNERTRMDGLIDGLAAEVSFILDVTQERPLPGVPPVLTERGDQTNFVANGLVLADGAWLVPDGLLASIWGCEIKHMNETADRAAISGLKIRQAIDIPCDFSFSDGRSQGGEGKPNRYYGLIDALALCDRRTSWADGWDRENAKRALNLGHDYRRQAGDTNPFRHRLAEVERDIARNADEQGVTAKTCDQAEEQLKNLNDRIVSLQADEHELMEIRRSGLFTQDEMAHLELLGATTAAALKTATGQREAHEQRRIALAHGREAYAKAGNDWPGTAPLDVLAIQVHRSLHRGILLVVLGNEGS